MKKSLCSRKSLLYFGILVALVVAVPMTASAREITPIVSTDWLPANLNNTRLVVLDVRKVEEYKVGHIPGALNVFYGMGHRPGAVNLPTSYAYNPDGTFKTVPELSAMININISDDQTKEIITYCDTGKFYTAWSFIMTELFGYSNVKVYDGSSQEWLNDPSLPAEM